MPRTFSALSALGLAASLAACGGASDADTSTTPVPAAATPPAEVAPVAEPADVTTTPAEPSAATDAAATPAAPAVDPAVARAAEADVAAFLAAANQSEIDAAKVAKKKAKNKEVKQFAQMMIDEHGAAQKAGSELVARVGITPAPGEVTAAAVDSSKQAIETLNAAKKGADFDRAYIDGQVAMHQQVISAIDEKVLPSAQNAEFKAFVESLRPSLQKHLEQAQAIQAKLATP